MQPFSSLRHGALRSVFILFVAVLFGLAPARAQSWLWARGAVGSVGPVYVTADAFDHEYFTGEFSADVAYFGTDTVTSPTASGTASTIFLAKYDTAGNVLWVSTPTGASGNDGGLAVATDHAGNLFLSGRYTDTLYFGAWQLTAPPSLPGHSNCNGFVAKYDSAGNVLWAKPIKTDGAIDNYLYATQVATDVAGNVYVGGSFSSTTVTFDTTVFPNPAGAGGCVFLARFSASGTLAWAKVFFNEVQIADLATDALGHIYFTGCYYDSLRLGPVTLGSPFPVTSIFITKYDTAGNLMWAKTTARDTNIAISGIAAGPSGDLWMTGFYTSGPVVLDTITLSATGSPSFSDAFISRFDSAGHVLWAKNAVGLDEYYAEASVATDNAGNAYLSGIYTIATAVFDTCTLPNPGAAGATASFVAKYDAAGNAMWAVGPGGPARFCTSGLAVNNAGQLYLLGMTGPDPVYFGPDVVPDGYQLFLARLSGPHTGTTAVPEVVAVPAYVAIYPNPATSQITISCRDKITSVSIINVMGETVYSRLCNTAPIEIDVTPLPPGTYVVKVSPSAGPGQAGAVGKFVKE